MRSCALRFVLLSAGIAVAACRPEATDQAQKFLPAPEAARPAKAELANDSKALLATVDGLKNQLAGRPRDFNVNVALGNLFYENRRYIEAIQYYGDALITSAAAEKKALEGRAAKAGRKRALPEACRIDRLTAEDVNSGRKARTFEAIAVNAEALEAKDPAGARLCWEQLADLAAGLHAKRGNSWYLIGNPEKAKEDHAAALAIDPDEPEALFFSGALAFEFAQGERSELERGKALWQRLVAVHPEHPRAVVARDTLPKVEELFGPRGSATGAPSPVAAAPEMAEDL